MGLNYRYLLYFKRQRLWDVLNSLAEMADSGGMATTTVHFPGHDQVLPLTTSFGKPNEIQHDAPEYEFILSLYFEQDPAILEYIQDRDDHEWDRSPPDDDAGSRVDGLQACNSVMSLRISKGNMLQVTLDSGQRAGIFFD